MKWNCGKLLRHGRLIFLYWLCAATDCQLPRPILNAVYKLVDNHTKPGAIAQYTCFNGYVPQSKSMLAIKKSVIINRAYYCLCIIHLQEFWQTSLSKQPS